MPMETKIGGEFTLENSLSLFITVNEYAADFKYGHLFIREYQVAQKLLQLTKISKKSLQSCVK